MTDVTIEGSDGNGRQRRRGRRWTVWALVASVSANLLVAGLWAGSALREDVKPRDRGERVMFRLLPEEHHERWRAAMEAAEPEIREIRTEMMYAHRDIVSAIRSEPFEIEALAKAFENRRSLHSGMKANRHARLVEMAATMTPEQREAFAERVQRMSEMWAKRRRLPPPGER